MMTSAGIVVAGGGLAGQRCCETLRARGYDGPLRMVCAEERAPYDRPPLSKQVLAGTREVSNLGLRAASWHDDHGVELLLGRPAVRLDAARRRVVLADGSSLRFARLLVATGGRPRRLPALSNFENVHVLRTADDASRLSSALGAGGHLAVIGAGLIGLEVAATARRLGVAVTVVEAQATPLEGVVGRRLGHWFADMHRAEGADVLCGARLAGVAGGARIEELRLADDRRIACDAVLVGVGMRPEAAWLCGSGLDPRGVPVDEACRTAVPHVYAAGDVALPFDPSTGRHERADHWESAARGGAASALAMLGLPLPPRAPATFWTDQYETRVQIVGRPADADAMELDGRLADRDFAALLTRRGQPVAGVTAGRPRAFAALRRTLNPIPATEAA